MRRLLLTTAVVLALALPASRAGGYLVQSFWLDFVDIVMDDVLLPAATWSDPAQLQMSEWNQVDTTDNSHAFRINLNPQFSFGANDGDNTIGFLGEAGLDSEYGLSFQNALAWTVCWSGLFGLYDECDVIMDAGRPWSLSPHDSTWFQSTVLHELGHVRGLGHYNNFLSMQNSGTSKLLRAETLYMDDKEGVRQHASHVSEMDAVMYAKWHDGSAPRWMSMAPTSLTVGQTAFLQNVTIENRGTQTLSPLRFGVYLSTDTFISTSDQLINTGSFSSFGRFTYSTFNWSATIPQVSDCGTYYLGGIVDYEQRWAERFEGNNAVAFSNGVPFVGSIYIPTPLTVKLADDFLEPNDTLASARDVPVPFSSSNLSIDTDNGSDYYEVFLPSGNTLRVNAQFNHFQGNLDLELLSSGGAVLASSRSTTSNESITATAGPGTFLVRVYGSGVGSCNRYSLSITHGPCGDGVCSGATGESAWTCPLDCQQFCGDGLCEASKGETEQICPADCNSCGNGLCEPFEGEDAVSCPADCNSCGNGLCEPFLGEDELTCFVDCCIPEGELECLEF